MSKKNEVKHTDKKKKVDKRRKKDNTAIIFVTVIVVIVALVVGYIVFFQNTTENLKDDTTEQGKEIGLNEVNDGPSKSDARVLPDEVKLNDGSVIKKEDISKTAEEFIPESLPKEITSLEDLIKYNEYVETLPDGKQKEMLLLKMQMFLEQNQ